MASLLGARGPSFCALSPLDPSLPRPSCLLIACPALCRAGQQSRPGGRATTEDSRVWPQVYPSAHLSGATSSRPAGSRAPGTAPAAGAGGGPCVALLGPCRAERVRTPGAGGPQRWRLAGTLAPLSLLLSVLVFRAEWLCLLVWRTHTHSNTNGILQMRKQTWRSRDKATHPRPVPDVLGVERFTL